tara:strand:+ start:688 stop:1473 length:786 start_codon:yes stop_codon:yes gene_type:complete
METLKSMNPFQEKTKTQSIIDSVKSMSPLQEKSTTQNVFDSVKSMNPLQEKSNSEKVLEKFSFVPSNNSPSVTTNQNSFGSWITRFFLLFIIFILVIITFGAYLVKGKTEDSSKLRTVFSKGGNAFMDTFQQTFNKLIEGTRFSGGVLAGSVKSVVNLIKAMFTSLDADENAYIKQKPETSKKEKKDGKNVEKNVMNQKKEKLDAKPDESKSSIQEKKKPGFCFVGYQSPHNACIQLDDVKKCMSGKVFDTMDQCVNFKSQ